MQTEGSASCSCLSLPREAGRSHDPQDTPASLRLPVSRTRRPGIILQFFPFYFLIKFKIIHQLDTVFLRRRAFCFASIFVCSCAERGLVLPLSLVPLHFAFMFSCSLSAAVQYFINLPSTRSCFLPAPWRGKRNIHIYILFCTSVHSGDSLSLFFHGFQSRQVFILARPFNQLTSSDFKISSSFKFVSHQSFCLLGFDKSTFLRTLVKLFFTLISSNLLHDSK